MAGDVGHGAAGAVRGRDATIVVPAITAATASPSSTISAAPELRSRYIAQSQRIAGPADRRRASGRAAKRHPQRDVGRSPAPLRPDLRPATGRPRLVARRSSSNRLPSGSRRRNGRPMTAGFRPAPPQVRHRPDQVAARCCKPRRSPNSGRGSRPPIAATRRDRACLRPRTTRACQGRRAE